jgi:hypothetical protein
VSDVTAVLATGVKRMADGYALRVDPYFYNLGDLLQRGWSLIPLKPREEVPAIKSWLEYQRRPPTFDELETWFERGRCNVGIVTGKVSGIFVIDADSPAALAWCNANLPPCELRVRTAKGQHLYYPYSGDRPIKNKVRVRVDGKQLALDVRAEGGYVVGPGSVHPNGTVYEREGRDW